MKKMFVLILVCLLIFVLLFINVFISARNMYRGQLDFVITKIEISGSRNLILYDDYKRIPLVVYSLMDNSNVRVGDKIFKKSCGSTLYVLRKNDENGNYNVLLQREPTSLIPMSWFCEK